MVHHEEHPNPNPNDDPHTSPMVLGAVLGVLLVIVTMMAVTALYYRSETRVDEQRMYDPEADRTTAVRLNQQQAADISKFRWTDPDHGRVGIPIDQAMELTAKELAARQGRNP